MMVKTLADIFAIQGWEVATAYSGSAAVELATTGSFDVVLMDVKMPGMDGVTALKAMKAARQDLRVVLMTAYAAEDRLMEAEREGVLRIMPKPVDVGALLTMLAEAVRLRHPLLLVDHDAPFLKTLSEVLQLQGFETVLADNLEHAKRLMTERKPVAVLLHLHLGSVPAREAVTVVHEVSPAVALILYSGQPGAAEELEHAVPGEWIHAYLQKPFKIEQVTGVLDAIRDTS
jgi:DNA-binding NtrC family response regulator